MPFSTDPLAQIDAPGSEEVLSSLPDDVEVTLRLTKLEALQLEQRARQYNLSLQDFVRRRTLGLRFPRFIGDVFERIQATLGSIDSKLTELNQNLYLPTHLASHPELGRDLNQLTQLTNRVKSQLDP